MHSGHAITSIIPNTTKHLAVFKANGKLEAGTIAFWALCEDGKVRGFWGNELDCPEDCDNFDGYMTPDDLYEARRELRNLPDARAQQDRSWDKGLVATYREHRAGRIHPCHCGTCLYVENNGLLEKVGA